MSYDIYLVDENNDVIEFDDVHHISGGTRAIGGTTEAWLNVTWNYGKHFARVLGENGIRTIYGMKGKDAEPILRNAALMLLDDFDDKDYWNPTEGNAKRALLNLADLAALAPDGTFTGD